MRRVTRGGGWPAIWYALRTARKSGGVIKFLRALRTPNACKTCALGMGGQHGAMTDESGRFPEICKKSMQAMAADMQGRIADEFFSRYSIAQLSRCTPRELEHAGRLATPLFAGPNDTHFHPIAWDEAIARCVEQLKHTTADQNFFYASGRSSNEAAFLLQLFARVYGTNHVNNCSYYCHQASGVGLGDTVGTGTSTIALEDMERCDTVFLIGGNPASNHPRMMRMLMNLRRRGGEVIVINPIRETGLVNFAVPSDLRSLLFGSEIASLYLQPHIGGDIALLTGIAKRLIEWGAAEEGFIREHTEGFPEFEGLVVSTSRDDIEARSGVPIERIDEAARRYAASRATIFCWTMGITHHLHGVDNVRAIVNLALLRGMVGREGSGLLPIRGHSNVQGVGSVGVTPALKQAVFDRLERHFGVALPRTKGLDTLSCLEAALNGRIRAAWCLGGNLFGATPDERFARRSFAAMDWVCYMSTTLNTGHVNGRAKNTMILPMLARDEESQSTSQESMFNYVRLSDGGPARLEGPRSEVETIATIARGMLGDDGPIDWSAMQRHRSIREAIAAVVPGYEALSRIDETGHEFHVGGRTVHRPAFATPSGRARFRAVQLPMDVMETGGPVPMTSPDTHHDIHFIGALRLMTLRSEGQFNTVVYEEHDLYRHQERRDVILMNPADIERLGLKVDQRVTVRGPAGEMRDILVRAFDLRAGNAAMYYPEANVLIPTTADPESRTPAFKSVRVTIHRQGLPVLGS